MSSIENDDAFYSDPRAVAKHIVNQHSTIISQNKRIIELLESQKETHDAQLAVTKALDWKIWEYFRPRGDQQ